MAAKDKRFQTIGEVAVNYINYLEEPLSTKSIKTGFIDLDYISNGLQLVFSLQDQVWGKRHLLSI